MATTASVSLSLVLVLLVVSCDREFARDVSPTSPAGTLVVLSTPGGATTLRADGFDTLLIQADVGPELVKIGRAIEFMSTGGTFVGDSDGNGLTVPLGNQGSASVTLKSSRTPGTFTVTARLMEDSDAISGLSSLQVTFVEGDQTELLQFIEAPLTAPADGATASRFAVQISGQFPGDQRVVTYTTSSGSFSRDDVERTIDVSAGTDLVARVFLYSASVTGPAFVSATLNNFNAQTQIQFEPAHAEEILVSLDKFILPQNGQMVITATLLRAVGIPTPGTIVKFRAVDEKGSAFGTFRNVQRSQANGDAMATFLPDGGGTPGPAVIEVTAEGTRGTARAAFELVEPSD